MTGDRTVEATSQIRQIIHHHLDQNFSQANIVWWLKREFGLSQSQAEAAIAKAKKQRRHAP